MECLSEREKKRVYPSGPRYPMTAAWKADVRRRLDEMGMTQTDLAHAARVTPGSITNMLSDEQESSVAVPAVAKALGIGMPAIDGDAELAQLIHSLDEGQKRLVLEMVRQLTRRSK